MEVHHHSHTSRKKWTHYFWEFLMLFLAVFAGFLAENQREHFVERNRERQYMLSMLNDLKADTIELNNKGGLIYNRIVKHMDTVLSFIFEEKVADSNLYRYYINLPWTMRVVNVVLEDRTSSQLKSSGNLRLIHNRELMDSLATYWTFVNKLEIVLQENYEHERRIMKDMILSIINYESLVDNKAFFPEPRLNNINPRLINNEYALRVRLGNYIGGQRSQLNGIFKDHFVELKLRATNLIEMIKKEYNLK